VDAWEALICAALRRQSLDWRGRDDVASVAAFLERARYHGVLPLLAAEMRNAGADWPENVVAACEEAERRQAICELAHRAADARVVDALSSAGAAPLVLKGSGLAYTLYPSPILRPRADTDLLVPIDARPVADRALRTLGYVEHESAEGELVSYQSSWTHAGIFGASHRVDLHWRINNSQTLAKVTCYDELAARAVPVPALGANALTPCPVDALLFACVHRAGHAHAPYYVDGAAYRAVGRLIWLYDIHLLVSAMSLSDLDEFAALASSKRVKAICLEGLLGAREKLGTPVPPEVIEALSAAGPPEPSACYLAGSKARIMLEDCLALDDWAKRIAWAREIAFPPARYMRAKYPRAAVKWLPVLYMRRGFTGISRLLAPGRASGVH
jgi:hypothetical protein